MIIRIRTNIIKDEFRKIANSSKCCEPVAWRCGGRTSAIFRSLFLRQLKREYIWDKLNSVTFSHGLGILERKMRENDPR